MAAGSEGTAGLGLVSCFFDPQAVTCLSGGYRHPMGLSAFPARDPGIDDVRHDVR
ncbi:hypothetical protein [Luteimonas sp. R10]|uniref:hypothetical protein n=1 Tax=Luteimonas sp. R10 TaxID=3108176 RepID=UPI00309276C9|nr:hypothetical protein U3649_11000 [Luteimonas sp. R10]